MAVDPMQTDLAIDNSLQNDPNNPCITGCGSGDHVTGCSPPVRDDTIEDAIEGKDDRQTVHGVPRQKLMNSSRSFGTLGEDEEGLPLSSHVDGVGETTSRTLFNHQSTDTTDASVTHTPDDEITSRPSSKHKSTDTTNAALTHSHSPDDEITSRPSSTHESTDPTIAVLTHSPVSTTRNPGAYDTVHQTDLSIFTSPPAPLASGSTIHGTTHIPNTLDSGNHISIDRTSQLEARRQES